MVDHPASHHHPSTNGKTAANLSSAKLAELSNLGQDELEAFKNSFNSMPEQQRLGIVKHLVELAENDVELNFDSIFKYCLKDPDAEVRTQAIEGLWENEESTLIAPLLDLFNRDESEKVRAVAAIALGRFILLGEHGKLRAPLLDRISRDLLSVLNDNSTGEEVRRRALEAVSALNSPAVVSAINQAYCSPNPRLKVSSIFAMGRSCDSQWLPILISELSNTDPEIRFEAATAIGEQADESAVLALIKIGGDPDTEVRLAVIQALGKIGGTHAKEYLQGLLGSRDAAINELARQALDELRANDDPLSLHSLTPDEGIHDDDH
jgi:HEAT repeat protein